MGGGAFGGLGWVQDGWCLAMIFLIAKEENTSCTTHGFAAVYP